MMKKRLHKKVSIKSCDGGFSVELDGRAVNTPAHRPLIVATEALAEVVAGEWRAQDNEIRQETMPFTRYVCTALDRVAPQRAEVILETVKYAETDLLCYRAEAPLALAKRQAEVWQPLLNWAAEHYDAVLATTIGVVAIAQDGAALTRLCQAVEAENDLTLAGLHVATATSGSLIVALALMEQEIDAEQAWQASHIEERWQLERWGEDEELLERLESARQEISDTQEFISLSRG